MARLADELGERVMLQVQTFGGRDERVELGPRNPAAAVTIEHDPESEDLDEGLWGHHRRRSRARIANALLGHGYGFFEVLDSRGLNS